MDGRGKSVGARTIVALKLINTFFLSMAMQKMFAQGELVEIN